MTQSDWTPHGTDEQYWRSDNPYLHFWYRFGDESLTPESVSLKVTDDDPDLERSHMSGLLVDSGPSQWHLYYGGGTTRLSRLVKPTSGFAPWATGGSGMCYGGLDSNVWVIGSHSLSAGWVSSELWNEIGTGPGNLGHSPFPFGTSNLASGAIVMGWFKVPPPDPSDPDPTFFDEIFGNIENSQGAGGGTGAALAIGYRPDDLLPIIRYRLAGAAAYIAVTGDASIPFAIDEPMFIAVQIHREDGVPGGFINSVAGSGILRVLMGSHVSGLVEVAAAEIAAADTRLNRNDATACQWGFGTDAQAFRTTHSNDNHVAPDFCLDEWVCLTDGRMSRQRIQHYMNSGITHLTTEDPTHPDFKPINPGVDDLVGYWTFDDQTGTNSAPATSGLAGMDMEFGSSIGSFAAVPGIRGGSGIRPLLDVNRSANITDSTFSSEKISTGEASINRLFPDINVSDQWTWIGWMNPQSTGVTRYGGVIGWFGGGANNDWTAWGIGDWEASFAASSPDDDKSRGLEWSPSGMSESQTNGTFSSLWDGAGKVGTAPDTWQLWALVIDFRHGVMYSVRDAKYKRMEDQRFSSVSGFSKDRILALTNYGFGFGSIVDTNTSSRPLFDDWAVYSRALSLAEMSGYATSGAVAEPSPFSTSFKQTLGYWIFDDDNKETYGGGLVRHNDSSWYRHHLTNISGVFTVSGAVLNERISNSSLEVLTSGSMLSLERVYLGSNLDLSDPQTLGSSGFSAGCWAYMPSGVVGEGGDGLRGDGDHHLLGHFSQSLGEQSWQLGIRDDKFYVTVKGEGIAQETLESDPDVVRYNKPFFVGFSITPSGAAQTAEIWFSEDFKNRSSLQLVGRSTAFTSFNELTTGSASGFSVLNVPNMQQGFPSGTRIQGPFVYAGGMDATEAASVAKAGINNTILSSGLVGPADISNLSHWRLDEGPKVLDFGRAQNILRLINGDGNGLGTFSAIHSKGVVIRQNEYLADLNAPGTSGDIGRDTESFTVLGWAKFNEVFDSSDRHVLFNEGGPESGVQIYSNINSARPRCIASGAEVVAQNGDLPPSEWAHIAFTYDRDNNEFTSIVNGRYAGFKHNQVLPEVPASNSGIALGGRGDPNLEPIKGGAGFSGLMDDWMVFRRALTLPEISGLAANSNSFNFGQTSASGGPVGAYVSGIFLDFVSGVFGAFIHGLGEISGVPGGYVSGVQGAIGTHGGFLHGKAGISGVHGGFLHGVNTISGVFGTFVHGLDTISGIHGGYTFGLCQDSGEFDIAFVFQVVAVEDFDARIAVELTRQRNFDAQITVFQITLPPVCAINSPLSETVLSASLPTMLTVQGSGKALNNKHIEQVRFTFADFKGATSGTLVGGVQDDGLFEATRQIDTEGLYTVKIEVIDSFGYRGSCAQQILVVDSASTSGALLAALPKLLLTATVTSGDAKLLTDFTHSISSGLDTISGILEYTDYSDQQESLVTSLEMPTSNIMGKVLTVSGRTHEYTVPGTYVPVWAVSGSFGIVSETLASGIDIDEF